MFQKRMEYFHKNQKDHHYEVSRQASLHHFVQYVLCKVALKGPLSPRILHQESFYSLHQRYKRINGSLGNRQAEAIFIIEAGARGPSHDDQTILQIAVLHTEEV
jgi:hypothetical protein